MADRPEPAADRVTTAAPAAAVTAWRVEPALPTDRGLVGRLVEAVVAEDPSVAPEVAAGRLRAPQWLQQVRPDWAGVAVLVGSDDDTRQVVGYVAATTGPATGWRVLVHPTHRGQGVEAALASAAGQALAAAAAAAPPVVEPEAPVAAVAEPDDPTPPRRWRDRLLEPAGAAAILGAGLAAVLAVQVGAGPLADVLPFLDRDRPSSTTEADRDPEPADATTTPEPGADPLPGVVLTPPPVPAANGPAPAGGPGPGDQDAGNGPAPLPPPAGPGAGPGTPPGDDPGPASALLDPVVAGVVEVVDGTTGGASTPLTGEVRQVADAATDAIDGVLDPP